MISNTLFILKWSINPNLPVVYFLYLGMYGVDIFPSHK